MNDDNLKGILKEAFPGIRTETYQSSGNNDIAVSLEFTIDLMKSQDMEGLIGQVLEIQNKLLDMPLFKRKLDKKDEEIEDLKLVLTNREIVILELQEYKTYYDKAKEMKGVK